MRFQWSFTAGLPTCPGQDPWPTRGEGEWTPGDTASRRGGTEASCTKRVWGSRARHLPFTHPRNGGVRRRQLLTRGWPRPPRGQAPYTHRKPEWDLPKDLSSACAKARLSTYVTKASNTNCSTRDSSSLQNKEYWALSEKTTTQKQWREKVMLLKNTYLNEICL